jgi:hypothetical protein
MMYLHGQSLPYLPRERREIRQLPMSLQCVAVLVKMEAVQRSYACCEMEVVEEEVFLSHYQALVVHENRP